MLPLIQYSSDVCIYPLSRYIRKKKPLMQEKRMFGRWASCYLVWQLVCYSLSFPGTYRNSISYSGAPPYKRPDKHDECYHHFIEKGQIANLLYSWRRHTYVTERMLSLLIGMLEPNEEKRYLMDDIILHPWLRTYYSRYHSCVESDLLTNKN